MSHQRKELSSTSMARDDIDFQLRRLAQEKQSAVQLVERTQKELAITQDRMLALDASQMQLTEEKESLERQVTLLSTQAETAEAAEASRAVEHQDLLDKYLKLEQASREQEFTIGQLREQTSHLGESREAAQSLSAETDSLRQKYSALVSSSDALSRQVTSLNSQLEAAVAERVALTKQLQEKSSTCASLQARLDSSLFETARLEDLISQRAQSSSTLEGHQESLGEKLNTATLQNTELQAELRLANRRLFDAESRTHQIEATLADTQHSYSRTTASLAKTEEALSDLTKKYEGVKSLLREREGEVGDLTSREERQHRQELEGRRDLRVAIEEKEAALKDIRDLKLLLKNMESDEKDTAARIRRFDSRVFELQEAVERASTERDEAKSQLRKKQAEVQELQESLRTLDADRDELQNQLDDLADEEVRKMHVMSEVNQKADDLANLLMQRDKVIEGLRRDKEHARGQLEKMDERFRAMTEETSELRRRLTLKQNEVGAAGDDLMLMTRENQSLTTELASAAHERDRLKQKVAGYAEQVSSLEHSVRALEIERGDLLETYRTCLQERRKYEVDLGVMSESKARLSQTINELRGMQNYYIAPYLALLYIVLCAYLHYTLLLRVHYRGFG
jgi:chromosome segregation ATPase